MDIAILLIRVGVGATLAAHGAQKLFGWFQGHGIAGTAGFLESLGFRPAKAYAWLLGGAELLGGPALAVGLLTPVAATVVAAVMVGAILAVHREKGFFAAAGGYEYPLALALAAVATAFAGAGRYSLDHVSAGRWPARSGASPRSSLRWASAQRSSPAATFGSARGGSTTRPGPDIQGPWAEGR